MTRLLVVACLTLTPALALAQATPDTVRILAGAVAQASPSTDGATLESVQRLLETALGLMKRGASEGRCLEAGQSVYRETLQPISARRQAMSICASAPDMDVVTMALPLFAETAYRKTAFERAVALGSDDALRGKSGLLRLGLQAYASTSSSGSALTRAARQVRGLSPLEEACVRSGMSAYRTSFQEASAFERAVAECRTN